MQELYHECIVQDMIKFQSVLSYLNLLKIPYQQCHLAQHFVTQTVVELLHAAFLELIFGVSMAMHLLITSVY